MPDSNHNPDSDPVSTAWEDPRITAYILGELTEADLDAFERSLAESPELRQAVDQARNVTDQLEGLFTNESQSTLDGDRRSQILAVGSGDAVSDPSPIVRPRTSRQRRVATWLLAIAAGFILIACLIPVVKPPLPVTLKETSPKPQAEKPPAEVSMPDELNEELTLSFADDSISSRELQSASESLAKRVEDLKSKEPSLRTELQAVMRQSQQASTANPMPDAATGSSPASASGPSSLARQEEIVAGMKDSAQRAIPLDSLKQQANQKSVSELSALDYDRNSTSLDSKTALFEGETVRGSRKKLAKSLSRAGPTPISTQPDPASVRSASPYGIAPAKPAAGVPVSGLAEKQRALGRVSGVVDGPASTRDFYQVPTLQKGIATKNSNVWMESKLSEGRYRQAIPRDSSEALIKRPVNRDRFAPIVENPFKSVIENPLSTLSIDVDTASYSKVRRTLAEGRLPRPDAVRIEELVNYFDYQYQTPGKESKHPFETTVTVADCPWNSEHRLARVAIQGKRIDKAQRPPCNLVFLLDTSGSMNQPNKLPLVIEGMKMLTKQLNEQDRVAIVVYAGSAGMVLDSTPASKRKKIKNALSQLSAGGSTNGQAGIQLAYAAARDHFIEEGVNRVILCTDGDFNVGMSGTDELVRLITEEASDGIFLTTLGFGMGNHNDDMLEQISGKGNGNYAFIDTVNEAHKVLVRQTDATLVTIAKDVKIQIEFNQRLISDYRLIGYENRVLAKEDFNDDKKDAGEIGAGHQVTAFYELIPASGIQDADIEESASGVDPLKYRKRPSLTPAAMENEAMTVKLRYKQPDGDLSTLVEFSASDNDLPFEETDEDFRFAAAVASFGMLVRESEYAGDWSLSEVRSIAEDNLGADEFGLRQEFAQMVDQARRLNGE